MNQGYRNETIEFLERNFDLPRCYAVTLTMKQCIRAAGPNNYYNWVPLTIYDAEQNLRHFLNVLNRKFNRRRANKGQRIKVACVYEGDSFTKGHFHLVIETPKHISGLNLITKIRWHWPRTIWGHEKIDIQRCDAGWIRYMTKFRTKDEYDLNISWANTFLG